MPELSKESKVDIQSTVSFSDAHRRMGFSIVQSSAVLAFLAIALFNLYCLAILAFFAMNH